MADTKVTGLTNLGTVTDDDEFYVVNDPAGTPASNAVLASVLRTYALPDSTVTTVGASGSTETLAWATDPDSQVHDVTMDQNCTFSFGAAPSSGTLGTMTLLLSGAFTPTFPASVDWAGGTAPTYSSPGVYEFWTVDGGTTVYGHDAGQGFA